MDPWKEKITESAAYIQATEFKKLLSGVDQSKLSESEREYFDRAELVIETVLERLDNTDPRLVNVTALNQLQAPLQNAVSYLTSWIDGSGESYLTNYCEGALNEVIGFAAYLGPSQDIPEARKAVTSLRHSVARHNQVVEGEIQKVIQKGTDADATIDKKVASAQSEFQDLEKSIDDLDTDLKDIKAASAQVATEQQTAFTKAEADRSAAFNKLVTDKQKELGDSLQKMSSDTETAIGDIRKKVQADEKAAGDAKARIEEILGIVGEDALISDYAQTTRDERSAADLWRRITVGALAVAVGLAIIFAFTVDSSTPWQRIVTKAFIILSLGGIAGYAGKQSGEHRIAQREAEAMALQLKALKPYLYDLDDATKRDDLLVKIADRVFGQPQKDVRYFKSKKNKSDETLPTPQLVDVILELVKKLGDK